MSSEFSEYIDRYDFDRIVFYARKRFVDGCNTIDLMTAAKSDKEKEEIALVALLNVDDENIQDLQLFSRYSEPCKAIDFRDYLREVIWKELSFLDGCEYAFV